MTQLVSPYKDIIQYASISLEPYQMNSDILLNTKLNLKNKVENKCNKNCFIVKVHKILDIDDGLLIAENLSGNAIYNIKYHANVCIPVNNTYIIAKILIMNKKLILATNGPIRIFIPKNNIDTTNFTIDKEIYHKQTNKYLELDMHVKIFIINHRISENSLEINSIGILYNIATDKEINKYYSNNFEQNDNYLSLSDEEPTNELTKKSNDDENNNNYII